LRKAARLRRRLCRKFAMSWGAGLKVDGYEGEREGEEVGDVVSSLESRRGMAETGDEGEDDVVRVASMDSHVSACVSGAGGGAWTCMIQVLSVLWGKAKTRAEFSNDKHRCEFERPTQEYASCFLQYIAETQVLRLALLAQDETFYTTSSRMLRISPQCTPTTSEVWAFP